MVEGTPLLRVQAGNRLEGSNPFVSATNPYEINLPIRLRGFFHPGKPIEGESPQWTHSDSGWERYREAQLLSSEASIRT